jgi:hypothetical protein
MAFKLNSTPTKVAAYRSALTLPQESPFSLAWERGRQRGEITHISRESPSHSWSETFPERSNSVCGDQLSSTIEETGVCPLRGGLESGFDGLSVSLSSSFS